MRIEIQTIPHDQHRYETVGDYYHNPDNTMQIRVSDMGDWRMEFLVAVHEAIEFALCEVRGITEQDITAFDKGFEANREPDNHDEPGDHPHAPYRREHFFATSIERLIAAELGVDWAEYERKVTAL